LASTPFLARPTSTFTMAGSFASTVEAGKSARHSKVRGSRQTRAGFRLGFVRSITPRSRKAAVEAPPSAHGEPLDCSRRRPTRRCSWSPEALANRTIQGLQSPVPLGPWLPSSRAAAERPLRWAAREATVHEAYEVA
jgi:hypothetical protein